MPELGFTAKSTVYSLPILICSFKVTLVEVGTSNVIYWLNISCTKSEPVPYQTVTLLKLSFDFVGWAQHPLLPRQSRTYLLQSKKL